MFTYVRLETIFLTVLSGDQMRPDVKGELSTSPWYSFTVLLSSIRIIRSAFILLQDESSVEIHLLSGEVYRAKNAIIAVPPIYKGIAIYNIWSIVWVLFPY